MFPLYPKCTECTERVKVCSKKERLFVVRLPKNFQFTPSAQGSQSAQRFLIEFFRHSVSAQTLSIYS